jgi:hypothetical protein
MIHGLTPHFLSALLPPYVYEVSHNSLRNASDFFVPKIKKGYLLNSFLWTAIRDWNHTDELLRQQPSLRQFKNGLNNILLKFSNPLYNYGQGMGAVNHARLRMGLSGLNAHRKKYNFIPSNECPYCGKNPENESHYLWKCPNFANHRTGLVGTISQNIHRVGRFAFKCPPANKADYDGLTALAFFGSSEINYDENILIFKTVQEYITQTRRF